MDDKFAGSEFGPRQRAPQGRVSGMRRANPIKAGRKKKGQMQSAWYWPIYGEDDEICFTWSSSRGSAHIEQQLAGFEGVLLSDGYAAYDRYARNKPQITQAQCWAHTRRYFERAHKSDPAAQEALTLIGGLYRVEQQIREKDLEGQAKLDYRSRHALPIADAFFAWCHQQRQRMDLVNTDPLAKALVYADNHQAQLKVYLGDPDVPIDTNHLERALRVIPMGRKNWLFCWSEVGAKHVGIIQSLLTTCRLHNVDPYTYLVDVLQRVALHPARNVIELTPRVWKERFADAPQALVGDLHDPGCCVHRHLPDQGQCRLFEQQGEGAAFARPRHVYELHTMIWTLHPRHRGMLHSSDAGRSSGAARSSPGSHAQGRPHRRQGRHTSTPLLP